MFLRLLSPALMLCLFLSSAAVASPMSDGQAIGYIVSSNNGQVEMSKLADSKTDTPEVKKFAEHMVKVHVDRTAQFMALAKEMGTEPKTSSDTKVLENSLQDDEIQLGRIDGLALDKTFLRQEVDHHKKVIAEIQNQLLPSVKNEELKSVLKKMLPRINQNLSQAEKILASLK